MTGTFDQPVAGFVDPDFSGLGVVDKLQEPVDQPRPVQTDGFQIALMRLRHRSAVGHDLDEDIAHQSLGIDENAVHVPQHRLIAGGRMCHIKVSRQPVTSFANRVINA